MAPPPPGGAGPVPPDVAIDFLERQWLELAQRPRGSQHQGDVLGWMQTEPYLRAARAALVHDVMNPLLSRGILVRSRTF